MSTAEKLKEVLSVFDTRLSALEHTVNDVLIASLQQASDEYADEEAYGRFCDSYGKDIEPLSDPLKVLYGDDFDASRTLYDNLKKVDGYGTEGFDEATMIAEKIKELQEKIGQLQSMKGKAKAEEDEEEIPSEEQLAREFIMVK